MDVVEPPEQLLFVQLLLLAELILVFAIFPKLLQQLLGLLLFILQANNEQSSKQLLLYRSIRTQSSELLTTAW